jgi:ubiquinone/menaquinone biosynthesis C-methylase UbiE
MSKDPYETFAYDYDEFGSIDSYLGDERAFFEKLFNQHNVKTVLDCACGTGQHLYMMSEMGLDVRGSDYSASMLEVADRNLKARGREIPLLQCDFRYLEQKHPSTFDAVLCLTTALPHLHTDEDLVQALSSMRGRLNDKGLLVLTQGATHFNLRALPPVEVIVNREDFSRVFVKEYDDRFMTIRVLDLFHSADRNESNQYDIVYRLLLDDDYRRLLTEAGFTEIQIYGDYDMRAYDEESRRLIVVAQRNKSS